KYLIIAPVVVILVPVVFPGATARMLEGFGQIDVTGEAGIDTNAATSDRILFWPYIIRKIGDSPWIGHGRLAMQRTGLVQVLEEEYPGIGATQPHNMYLESLLDNGVLGSLPLFAFWAMMILYGARLFKNDNRLYSAIGGLVLSLTLAQLFAGVGSQHFYPEESTLGMWVAMFLSLRVYVEKQRAHMAGVGAETAWNPPPVSTMKKLVVSRTS
ncbi:MAG: O-antigen ligase domain-containing protein, partial [Planctomycetaceae bacterium]